MLAHGGIFCPVDVFAIIAWILTTLGGLRVAWSAWMYKRHHDQHHKDCNDTNDAH